MASSSVPRSPAALAGGPVVSDVSLIRLSPAADSPFGPAHPYVNPHIEHYLRSVHGSPTLSMISAARGLSPAERKCSVCPLSRVLFTPLSLKAVLSGCYCEMWTRGQEAARKQTGSETTA